MRADLLAEKAAAVPRVCPRREAVEGLREALELLPGTSRPLGDAAPDPGRGGGVGEDRQTRLKQAKDSGPNKPAAAPHFAAAGELYLKYRPRADDGEKHSREAVEIDPRQKRAEVL